MRALKKYQRHIEACDQVLAYQMQRTKAVTQSKLALTAANVCFDETVAETVTGEEYEFSSVRSPTVQDSVPQLLQGEEETGHLNLTDFARQRRVKHEQELLGNDSLALN